MVRTLTIASTQAPDGISVLSLVRNESADPWSAAEVKDMLLLEPHVRRVFEIHRRLEGAVSRARVVEDTLDRLRIGVVVVDGRGRTVFANRRASRIADAQGGFVLGPEGPAARDARDTLRLRRAITSAVSRESSAIDCADEQMAVSRPSLRRSCQIRVMRLECHPDWAHSAWGRRSRVVRDRPGTRPHS